MSTLRWNGREIEVEAPPTAPLLDVLRDELGDTTPKPGCREGRCGACTVLLDGEPVLSCLVPLGRALDGEVTTLEGLVGRGLSRVRGTLRGAGGLRAGGCGAVRHLHPGDDHGHSGTPGGVPERHGRADPRGPGQQPVPLHGLPEDPRRRRHPHRAVGDAPMGEPFYRSDARAKVAGRAVYGVDLEAPRMLVGRVVRSTVPRGRITRSRRLRAPTAIPGVTVITAADLPVARYGMVIKDQPPLASDVVRFSGEPLAAVAGPDEETVARAVAAVVVRIEPEPGVFDLRTALEPGAARRAPGPGRLRAERRHRARGQPVRADRRRDRRRGGGLRPGGPGRRGRVRHAARPPGLHRTARLPRGRGRARRLPRHHEHAEPVRRARHPLLGARAPGVAGARHRLHRRRRLRRQARRHVRALRLPAGPEVRAAGEDGELAGGGAGHRQPAGELRRPHPERGRRRRADHRPRGRVPARRRGVRARHPVHRCGRHPPGHRPVPDRERPQHGAVRVHEHAAHRRLPGPVGAADGARRRGAHGGDRRPPRGAGRRPPETPLLPRRRRRPQRPGPPAAHGRGLPRPGARGHRLRRAAPARGGASASPAPGGRRRPGRPPPRPGSRTTARSP